MTKSEARAIHDRLKKVQDLILEELMQTTDMRSREVLREIQIDIHLVDMMACEELK